MTIDEIKKYIEDNNIKKRNGLEEKNPDVYKAFCKLSKELKDELIPYRGKYNNYNTIDDFRTFILNNNISSRGEFDDKFSRVYKLFCSSLTEEEKSLLLPIKPNIKYEYLKSYQDFKEFIKLNNIVSRSYFYRDFPSAYLMFNEVLTDKERDSILPHTTISSGEETLIRLFKLFKIDYETQKTFDDLKSSKKLRYDFYVLDKILVEYQGHQHFDPNNAFYDPNGILRDRIKFEYAVEHNIPLLYFTNEINLYEKFGYFTEVITDANILIQKIKEIGLTNQSNS